MRMSATFACAIAIAGCALDRRGLAEPAVGERRDAGAADVRPPYADAAAEAGARLDAQAGPDAAAEAGARLDAQAGPDAASSLDAAARADGASDAAIGALDGGRPDAFVPPRLCVPDPYLIGCWPLDGDARDRSGRGNDLDATGVVWLTEGGALLGLTSSLVRTPRPELRHTTVAFDAWVRVDVLPTSGRVGIADHDGQFGMFVGPGGELRCARGDVGWILAPGAIRAGSWHHLACAHDGTQLVLYRDGIPIGSISAPPSTAEADTEFRLGENAPDGLDQLVGAIDDARLWNRLRTPDEIAADYARGRVHE